MFTRILFFAIFTKDLKTCKNVSATTHVFVKHRCPRRQQSRYMAKISKSYILIPPHPQGHVMSVKCEEPIDELTVQVWFLYHHPNFKYCTLFVSGTELRTDRRTDDPITRCPRRTFQAGGIKNCTFYKRKFRSWYRYDILLYTLSYLKSGLKSRIEDTI